MDARSILAAIQAETIRFRIENNRLVALRRSLMATADDFTSLAAQAQSVNKDLHAAAQEIEKAIADFRANPGDPVAQQKLDDAFASLQAVTGDHASLARELHTAAQPPAPPAPPAP